MLDYLPIPLLRFIAAVASKCEWLNLWVNKIAINATVNVARHRPHPLSTAHDYVSWVTLTDKKWSARHLPPTDNVPQAPISEVVKLFERPQGAQKLSARTSCLFPAFAQYLTDGFIRTRMPDPTIKEPETVRLQNTSNHDIDMCPLYGRTIAQTNTLRKKSNELGHKGQLKFQSINGEEYAPFLLEGKNVKAEFKDLDLPLGLDMVVINPDPNRAKHIFAFGGDRTNASPQVAMINTLFLREHNRLAREIEATHPNWDDERIFQTARNTVIVLFIKLVVEEYINHISHSIRFLADPSVAWDEPWNKPNWITTEFSLLYRWHALVPDQMVWNGKTYPVFDTLMNNWLMINTNTGLRKAFEEVSERPAGVLCAFNTPRVLMEREVSALEQGRLVRLPSYSDYREYVNLPRPKSFNDVTKNELLANKLKSIYGSVDEVEFYVGLFMEDLDSDSPLPPLMRKMVALDAFSQALTNPLLSKNVFNPSTFSEAGWHAIENTDSLADIVKRNTPPSSSIGKISMQLA